MRLLARALLSVLLFPAGVGFSEEPPPLEVFFEDPMLSHLALSPDGQQIAGRLTGEGHELIVVMDSSHPQIKSLMRLDDKGDSVEDLGWSGDGRIVGVGGRRTVGGGARSRRTVLFTVKDDGSGRDVLQDNFSRMNQFESIIIDWMWDDPDYIIANRWKQGVTDRLPVPVRVTHGSIGSSLVRKDHVNVWYADPEGRIRVGASVRELSNKLLYQLHGRVDSEGEVEALYEFEPDKTNGGWFLGFHPEPQLLYVFAETETGHTGVYEYDMRKRKLGKQHFARSDRDACGYWQDERRRILAVAYLDDGPQVHYLDDGYASLQRGIDKALPGMTNRVVGWSRDHQTLLLVSTSDVVAPRYYLLKRGADGGLKALFSSRPQLEGKPLSPMQEVSFESEPGVRVHATLTRPWSGSEAARVPFVVIPAAGEHSPFPEFGCTGQAYRRFDPLVQFFASRGYGVLEVNVRGTPGYGRAWRDGAGTDWARAMLADIEAAVQYAVAKGGADPKRIGIYGRAQGGYASLLAMGHHPDLFAAGGSFGGASDLPELRRDWKLYESWEMLLRYAAGFPQEGGSIEETSPARLAKRFKAPVILGHGDDDSDFRLAQSKEMKSELEAVGIPVELYRYRYEGDVFYDERNRIDYHRKLEAFFERHLKGSPGNQVSEAN